jgi:hypothetical protein
MQGKPSNAYERSMVGDVAGFNTFKLDSGAHCGCGWWRHHDRHPRIGPELLRSGFDAHRHHWREVERGQPLPDDHGVLDDQRCGRRLLHHRRPQLGASHQQGRHGAAQDVPRHLGSEFDDPGDLASDHLQPGRVGRRSKLPELRSQYGGFGNSAIVFKNSTAAGYNVFWRKPAIELLPGSYAVPSGQGVAVMKASTDNGIEVVMTKSFDSSTFVSTFTLDCRYGVVMTDPEQCGILLFGQA